MRVRLYISVIDALLQKIVSFLSLALPSSTAGCCQRKMDHDYTQTRSPSTHVDKYLEHFIDGYVLSTRFEIAMHSLHYPVKAPAPHWGSQLLDLVLTEQAHCGVCLEKINDKTLIGEVAILRSL